jgi:hypothetical protein
MYLTPIRVTALALIGLVSVAACGQVTGLSNDYQYDLEGGAAADGAADGAKTDGTTTGDGATDAATGTDATNKCSTSQTVKANQRLQQYNGTELCKTCLATSCCNDVDTCASNGDCNHVFSCKLDCTEKPPVERTQCFKSCTVNGGPSPLYQTTVGACAPAACSTQCGLQ